MAQVFQDGYYVISTIVDYDAHSGLDKEYEVIVDGPYLTESAAHENKNLNGGSTWVEYLTFENFEMITDGDAR